MLSVPVSIILHTLRVKKVNKLKLYLYLKAISSGQIKLSDEVQKSVCVALEWKDKRTFKSNLSWLLKHHWATYNSKTHSLRIISFRQLNKQIHGSVRTGVRMNMTDFKYFRHFIYATAISWSQIAIKGAEKRRSKCKRGRSKKSHPYSHFSKMPLDYLAKIVKLNKSTISKNKKAAALDEYIKIHHQYENLYRKAKYINVMRHYLDYNQARRLVVHNGRVHIQLPDIINSTLKLVYLKRLYKNHCL
jgi:hypothetical protein